MIACFDHASRTLIVSVEEWRDELLPVLLRGAAACANRLQTKVQIALLIRIPEAHKIAKALTGHEIVGAGTLTPEMQQALSERIFTYAGFSIRLLCGHVPELESGFD